MAEAGFQQAGIPVQSVEAFEELKAMLDRALAETTEAYLKALRRHGVGIRQLEAALEKGLVEKALDRRSLLQKISQRATPGRAQELYRSLGFSDQGLMREYYLMKIEQMDPELRRRYRTLFFQY